MNFSLAFVCLVVLAGSLVHHVQGQCTSNNYYAISPGETCDTIASKNKITFAMLVLLNPGIENRCPFPTGFVCVPSTFQPIVQPSTPNCVFSYRTTGFDSCTTIAAQYGTVVTVIQALNPSLSCQITLPAGTTVCVPNSTPSVPTPAPATPSCTFPYVVRGGETCQSIANAYQISLSLFLALNPTTNCANLNAGAVVCAPFSSIPSSAITTTTAAPQAFCTFFYRVRAGDTCDGISKAYGVSLALIFAINPTINCNNLQINQILCAPAANTIAPVVVTPAPTVSCSFTYPIKSGDTCADISAKYGITLAQFLSLNNNNINCNLLQIGQNVCVPSNSPQARCTFGHSVVKGNTCWDLCQFYGVTLEQLVNRNPALNCGNLQIGSILCIF